jgi:hypothetical protein
MSARHRPHDASPWTVPHNIHRDAVPPAAVGDGLCGVGTVPTPGHGDCVDTNEQDNAGDGAATRDGVTHSNVWGRHGVPGRVNGGTPRAAVNR